MQVVETDLAGGTAEVGEVPWRTVFRISRGRAKQPHGEGNQVSTRVLLGCRAEADKVPHHRLQTLAQDLLKLAATGLVPHLLKGQILQ